MKIRIIGNGSFGTFLKELLKDTFTICHDYDESARSIILAVPLSAYREMAVKFSGNYLINICSVQEPSTNILSEYTDWFTSIHPLFGTRTPVNKRYSILTHSCKSTPIYLLEEDFLNGFKKSSEIYYFDANGLPFTPESHDRTMAKTHLAAINALSLIKPFIDNAKDVDDKFIPNSFRLLREFAKTIEDMPLGTLESIKANTYGQD